MPKHEDGEIRAAAVESLLDEKGFITRELTDEILGLQDAVTHQRGAAVVARAWTDSRYRDRLFSDARAAVEEMGFTAEQGAEFVALENTEAVHNVIVCTLCSCYPSGLLGLAPNWYKDPAYRSRGGADPRSVLQEFGLQLPPDIEIRVWDSTAELRYMVMPQRPPNTEHLSASELAGLISRNAMVGTALI
jgi:nitrile hydratase